MENVTFAAPTIDCEACVKNIERSLGQVSGIQEVHVDLITKRASVSFDSTQLNAAAIQERLEAAGFPVEYR